MTQDPAHTAPSGDGSSSEVPAAFQAAPAVSPNGHTDAKPLTAAQQTAQGVSAIAGMLHQLPQALAGMLAQVARAIPDQHMCAQCVITRLTWETAHMAELKAAIQAARQAAGIPEGAPLPPGFDPAPFAPEHLRPGGAQGMPPVQPAITTVQGTEVCAAHIPGQPGGRQLLIAHGSLSSSLLSQFAA